MSNRLNKWLLGLLMGVVVFFTVTSVIQAQPEARFVRVGIYDNPPKIYRDAQGEVTGIFGDILAYIAQKENWQLNFVPGSFEDGLRRLRNGEIDIMVDVADSVERQATYDLTKETVLSSWGVVYVQKGSTIDSFPELDGKKIALLKSSVYSGEPDGVDIYVRAFNLHLNWVEVDEYQEVFNLLATGEVDAAISSRISGLAAEKKYPNIKATDIIFHPTELRFALTKGDDDNPYLIERLDYWVKQLRDGSDGAYHRSLKKHDLLAMAPQVEVLPDWVLPAGLGIIALVIFFLALAIGFRRALKATISRLAEKERYLGKVVNSVPVILSSFDKNGIITLAVGKSMQDITQAIKPLVGASVFEVFRDNPVIMKNVDQSLKGVETRFQAEVAGRVFQVMTSPREVQHQVVEVLLVAVDITEEYRLEKAKSEFVTMVQHQLRTPPGAMKWGLELLTPKVVKHLDADEKNIWRLLESQTSRMINLANSLTMVSQVETGLLPVKPETFSLPELAESIIKAHVQLVKEKKLTLNTDFHGLKDINHDKTIIGLVIQTLVSNAVYYSPPDGVIDLDVTATEHDFTFQVKDRGIGIAEQQKTKMFTNFYRGEEAAKFNPEGMGISLYLAKSLLELLGGKIWYESAAGQGSTFFVKLPGKVRV